jgi:hypothetical protein
VVRPNRRPASESSVAALTSKPLRVILSLLLAVVLCLAVAVAIVVAHSPSGDSTRATLLNDLSPLQGQLDFKPMVPAYLPAGTIHAAHSEVMNGELSFFMQMSDDSGVASSAHAYIEVDESLHALSSHIAQAFSGPQQGIDRSASFVTLAGQQVSISAASGPSVQANVELSSQIGDIYVWEGAIWNASDPNSTITLSDSMLQEAVKVFESMIQG